MRSGHQCSSLGREDFDERWGPELCAGMARGGGGGTSSMYQRLRGSVGICVFVMGSQLKGKLLALWEMWCSAHPAAVHITPPALSGPPRFFAAGSWVVLLHPGGK